jgi:Rrf2 family protein
LQISSRFTIAIHILICIATFSKSYKITSDFLASSINVNPVIIRRILQQLKNLNLILVTRGEGGATLARSPSNISLYDIFTAVELVENGILFHFHENPNLQCPVGKNIHNVLDNHLLKIQQTMEDEMKKTTLEDLLTDSKKYISLT